MTKRELEHIAKRMYAAVDKKCQFFRQAIDEDTGEVVPWSKLAFEKDMWIEMSRLAIKGLDKLEIDHPE